MTDGLDESAEKKPELKKHPIAEAIDRFVHRARDVKLAARQLIPISAKNRKHRFEEIVSIFEKKGPLLESDDRHIQIVTQKEIHETILRYQRITNSDVPKVLETGLFLSLFSTFDAFTGDLLRALYERRPELFESLSKTLTFAEVLTASSIEALKLQVLNDDIESLRRKSYSDQFANLGQRFDIKLTAFSKWPEFVECAQRRNLLTHCDGLVSEQYIRACRSAGIQEGDLPKLGNRVTLGAKYFYNACEVLIETGIKLGQTLWRKTLPGELADADTHLMSSLYEALENRIWPRAKMIGEFAYRLNNISSEVNRRIITINYVQALKRVDEVNLAKKILDDIDWSATANDFKLCRAVLLDDFVTATEIMQKIGLKGEYINETAYHTWPVFIEFRETEQFSAAYKEIFGHPYIAKLREDVTETSKKAVEEIAREDTNRSNDGDKSENESIKPKQVH